jgi:hypothetical protein
MKFSLCSFPQPPDTNVSELNSNIKFDPPFSYPMPEPIRILLIIPISLRQSQESVDRNISAVLTLPPGASRYHHSGGADLLPKEFRFSFRKLLYRFFLLSDDIGNH